MLLTTTEIARTLGIRTYQLAYAHQQGYIREPRRLAGRRVDGPDDVAVVQRYVEAHGLVGRRRGLTVRVGELVRFQYRGRDCEALIRSIHPWGWKCQPTDAAVDVLCLGWDRSLTGRSRARSTGGCIREGPIAGHPPIAIQELDTKNQARPV